MDQSVFGFLFSNSLIREYFSKFNREEWSQVLFSTVLFGIQAIQVNKDLPVNYKVSSQSQSEDNEENMPSIKAKLEELKREIKSIEEKFEEKPQRYVERFKEEPFEQQTVKHRSRKDIKKADFWYQTDLRGGNERTRPGENKKNKAWVHDFTNDLKNSKNFPTSYEDL